jgi:hypothetical protein
MTDIQRFLKESKEYRIVGYEGLLHYAVCALISIAENQEKEIEMLKAEIKEIKENGKETP